MHKSWHVVLLTVLLYGFPWLHDHASAGLRLGPKDSCDGMLSCNDEGGQYVC